MADISKKLTLLRGLYAKMPEGGGKKAVASKIAKLEASQPKEVVEVKEEVKEVKEVIKKPKAPKKASKGKEMRHVFEKEVVDGKEVKVVMATSVDLAKEAMQESGFEYSRTITRGRSPKEGFSPQSKPKKTKKTKETKRATKATRDEMADDAGMTPEKAEKVSAKVASAKKRGRKPAKHNAYLFEMPMKTQAGKVKRKVIVATSEASAQKQAGRNYTFIKELKAGEKPKTGIQPVKDFVAPPPKKRGRRPKAKAKTEAEMEKMSDLYSELHKKVKGKKSKKSKVAKKSKASKKTSKSDDLTQDFKEITERLGEVKFYLERVTHHVGELDTQIEKFSKKIESKKFAEGGITYVNDDFPELFDSQTYVIDGIYGSNQTPTEVYVMELEGGGKWYAARDSVNVNYTNDSFYDGVDIETISDIDTITASKPIEYSDDLEDLIVRHYGEMLEERGDDYYAKGGIMADGRLVLGSSNGVGGNKNKTYKLIKDDRDGDEPYYEVVEHPSNLVMAQGDDFVEVNNMYKLFTGKQ